MAAQQLLRSSAVRPVVVAAGVERPTVAPLGALRLRLRELSVRAGLGASPASLAPGLRDVHRTHVAALAPVDPAALQTASGVFLQDLCRLARWFDPARSVEVVPPLCVVLWHVGASSHSPDPATLWIDFVIPGDGRGAAARAWARDVRLLLSLADLPHLAETVAGTAAAAGAAPVRPTATPIAVWGCMSLQPLSGPAGADVGRAREGATVADRR